MSDMTIRKEVAAHNIWSTVKYLVSLLWSILKVTFHLVIFLFNTLGTIGGFIWRMIFVLFLVFIAAIVFRLALGWFISIFTG
jgi:heme/copper-type cytochrome/quinol oxidase subunit 4